MKYIILLMMLAAFMLFTTGCHVYHAHSYYKGQVVSSKPNGKISPDLMAKKTGELNAKEQAKVKIHGKGLVKKHKRK